MKQYRLKKDFYLPDGKIILKDSISKKHDEHYYYYFEMENFVYGLSGSFVESNTEFFEEVSNRWKPVKNQLFWYIDLQGSVYSSYWDNDYISGYFFDFGNCFSTREAAESARDKVKSLLLELQEEK